MGSAALYDRICSGGWDTSVACTKTFHLSTKCPPDLVKVYQSLYTVLKFHSVSYAQKPLKPIYIQQAP